MNWKRTGFVLAAGLVVWASGALAQQKLGDLVTEGGFDWMIGEWTATTDEGDKIDVAWKWELDRNMVGVYLKWPNYEYRGMIFYIPAEEKIVQVGVDNRGGNGKGVWENGGDRAIHKYEHTDAEGQTNKMGMAHSKVDNDTMKVEVYEIQSTGEFGESPAFTTEYKRQKKQPPKEAGPEAGKTSEPAAKEKTQTTKIAEIDVVR
jgi:hypothetical protein